MQRIYGRTTPQSQSSERLLSRLLLLRDEAVFSLPAYRSKYFHLHKLKSSEFRNWGIDNRQSWGQPPNTENQSREWFSCTSPGLDFVNSRLILVSIFQAHLIKLMIKLNQDCRQYLHRLSMIPRIFVSFRHVFDRHFRLLFSFQYSFLNPAFKFH